MTGTRPAKMDHLNDVQDKTADISGRPRAEEVGLEERSSGEDCFRI